MQTLEALTREARALAMGELPGAHPAGAAEAEIARQMQICNACRYCEGFCAVFPAMTRRLEFGHADVHYLANLCHNCGACLHACQYAPPHEFAVNVPKAMARVRARTYIDYAWPAPLGALYQRNGLTLALALAGGLALFLVLMVVLNGAAGEAAGQPASTTPAAASAAASAPAKAGNFYSVFPHHLMVGLFAPIFAFAVLALTLGVRRFWREVAPPAPAGQAAPPTPLAALNEAASNTLRLKYLDGGHGQGCNEGDDRFTLWRRRFHHLTFYGFLLCFASTSVATLYHYAWHWPAPYPLTSLPVLLGTAGGIGLLIGPAGLAWLHLHRHPQHGDAAQRPMDLGFIALLFATSLTGLALMAWRDTAAMAVLLAIHLGVVMALFATLPYGKFAHGIFRTAALLKWAIERRRPDGLRLGGD